MTKPTNRPDDGSAIDVRDPRVQACIDRYWRSNVRIMGVLLLIWAMAGLGCGVLFADFLNRFSLGGMPLGFWFAQQGSIIVFVLIIFIYAVLLNRLDARHHSELVSLRSEIDASAGEDAAPSPPGADDDEDAR